MKPRKDNDARVIELAADAAGISPEGITVTCEGNVLLVNLPTTMKMTRERRATVKEILEGAYPEYRVSLV